MNEFVSSQASTPPPRRRPSFSTVKRHWLTFAFFAGFIVDVFLLNRVDDIFDNLVLLFYVLLAFSSLLIFYASVAERFSEKVSYLLRTYAPLAIQYSFGGLLSGMLIFYGRSGDWSTSWPFLLIILIAILGNEFIKERSSRLIYNLAFLFIGLMAYMVLLVPVLSGYMGVWPFIVSGLLALCIFYGFIRLLYRVIPRFMDLQMRIIVLTIGAIYMCFNLLYFVNIIPPIPLSLKDLGIYHSVIKFENNTYQLKWIDGPWWRPFKRYDDVFYPSAAPNVYCFASVFAPTRVDTDIYHRWEYKDEAGDWIVHARIKYPIQGGNDSGWRGYTQVASHRPGEWRCSVETERGQVLGHTTFRIAPGSEEPPREMNTRVE